MRYRILVRKLGFLHHVIVSNPVIMTGRVILALCDDADSLLSGEGLQGAEGKVWINFHRYHPQQDFLLTQRYEEGDS